MFGEDRKITALRNEIEQLREYCIKFTNEVNAWAQAQGKLNQAVETKLQQLEEKQNG